MATKKKKKDIWFRKTRGSYLPCAPQAWALYAFTIVYVFVPVISHVVSHQTVIYTITGFIVRLFLAWIVLTYIAKKKS